jgi:O-antigen/teichoic acid export membrane protein
VDNPHTEAVLCLWKLSPMRIKNIVWNLAGLGGPLVVAALTVPALIEMIGMERFGLLALAWGLIGFAGIFDLGIGRATTQTVAKLRGAQQLGQVPAVLKTAASLSFRTGAIGAMLLAIAVLAGAHTQIKYKPALNTEVTIAAYLLALAIPIQSMSAMFRGVNEAFENFREISFVRICLGTANFLGPYCVSLFSSNLAILVLMLLISRIAGFLLYRLCAQTCINREIPISFLAQDSYKSSNIAKKLLFFGGWITISNTVYPIMMQADRFFISANLSPAAVSEYVIPYEMVMQSLFPIGAVTTTLFPTVSLLLKSNPQLAMRTFYKWLSYTSIFMLGISIALATLLPIILQSWLGNNIQKSTILVGQILSIGLVPYTIGTMYLLLIHAKSRSDITAKAHLVEMPVYLVVLYFSIYEFGVIGAASVWVGRVIVDTLILVLWNHFYRVKQ